MSNADALSSSHLCEKSEVQMSTTSDIEAGHSSIGSGCSAENVVASVAEPSSTTPDGRTKVAITFKDLSYAVKVKLKPKTILDNVNGFFYHGNLTAIMGPSGSGKTTLMDLVACRKNSGSVSGELLLNGQPLTPALSKANVSYVEQSNVLLESLTVEEMLTYTAALCWPWQPKAWRRELVDSLLGTLGLHKCRSSTIGGPTLRGISGGEARRTFIGIALVAKPQVLLLDEPTSGLDSFMSREVMSFIKLLVVQRGITVATTIHQPSTAIFATFDWLMLVLRGKLVFFGDVGQVEGALGGELHSTNVGAQIDPALLAAHFKGQVPYSEGNLAEAVMDYICVAERDQKETALAAQYEASPLAADNMETLESLRHYPNTQPELRRGITKRMPSGKGVGFTGASPQKWYQLRAVAQLKALLRYRMLANLKHPAWWFTRVISLIVTGFVLCTVYMGSGDEADAKSIQDTSAVLFLLVFVLVFNAISFIGGIVQDRAVFYHENDAGLYWTVSYMLATSALELVVQVPGALLLSLVVYYVVQLQGSWFLIAATLLVVELISMQLALLGAAIGPTADSGSMIVLLMLTMFIYTAGFYVNFDNLFWGWRWMGYINFMRFGYYALLINQFDGVMIEGTNVYVLEAFGLVGESAWKYLGFASLTVPVVFALAWLAFSKLRFVKR